MPNLPKNKESKESLRRLAGMIARLPDANPPEGITAAVMGRIQPKKIGRRRKWLRRLSVPWTLFPVQAVAAATVAALIVGSLVWIKAIDSRRRIPTAVDDDGMAVTFVLDLPSARKVSVIGSFNHWNPDGCQMHRTSATAPWQLILKLEKGKYQYAFMIDDQRVVPDPNALWLVDDGFGNLNSTLIVENGNQYAHES